MAEAQAAIDGASGSTLLEQTLQCDFAFVRPPPAGPKKGRGREGRGRSALAHDDDRNLVCYGGKSRFPASWDMMWGGGRRGI